MCVVLVKVNPRAQFPKKEVEVRKELLFLGESMNDWQHMNEYMYVCVCVAMYACDDMIEFLYGRRQSGN